MRSQDRQLLEARGKFTTAPVVVVRFQPTAMADVVKSIPMNRAMRRANGIKRVRVPSPRFDPMQVRKS